ncbi:MAG: GNAT family N-acetyltransferase [Flavobacteriales bacterium]|nr:GNAT family N-acetyltransferase [Flavobacteriales bacterium]
MSLEIREVISKKDFKEFVDVQFDIYKNNKYWVPPIKKDEIKALNPTYNPAFRFCKAKFWIATKDGKCVGRIGAIINNDYNKKTGEKTGRFSRTEFINDKAVSKILFDTAEKWLKNEGMTKIQGPLGFTNLDHQGMLVEGFDHLPSAASEYHLPYYQEHMIANGFEKEIDWIEFRLFLEGVPEKAKRVAEVIKTRNGLTVKSFTNSNELRPFAYELFDILNIAFKELFSVVHLDKEMIDYYVNRYLMLLNPEFVKIISDAEGKTVAFIVGLPSLSEGLQKAKGKIFPFGWYHIKQSLKKPKVVDLMLTGILPDYQGKGVAAILINELQTVMEKYGVTEVETTGIFEDNQKAIQNWKNYENIQHKRKRCWKKNL